MAIPSLPYDEDTKNMRITFIELDKTNPNYHAEILLYLNQKYGVINELELVYDSETEHMVTFMVTYEL